MQVENSLAYTSPLYTRAAHPDENKNGKQTSTPTPSQSGETNTANTAKAEPVTGTTGNNLSKEVMSQLIATTQETNTSNTDPKPNADFPIAYTHWMQDIAKNPDYADKQAKGWATSPVLIGFRIPPDVMKNMRVNPGQGPATPEENAAFEKYVVGPSTTGTRYPIVNAAQDKLKDVYEASIAQGKTGAEAYAAMLETQISQPQEYWNALDPYSDQKPIAQGKLQALRQAMTEAASSSVKTADTTKVTG